MQRLPEVPSVAVDVARSVGQPSTTLAVSSPGSSLELFVAAGEKADDDLQLCWAFVSHKPDGVPAP